MDKDDIRQGLRAYRPDGSPMIVPAQARNRDKAENESGKPGSDTAEGPGKRPNDNKKKERRTRRWLIRLLAVLPLIIIIPVLHRCDALPWNAKPPGLIVAGDGFPGEGDAQEGHLPGMSEDEIRQYMQQAADSANFAFKINGAPVFRDGESPGSLGIENPRYNVYPMVVQITLDATGAVIYDSGGILPDHHIASARLSADLGAGRHAATAHLHAYDPRTKQWRGEAQAALVITVKN